MYNFFSFLKGNSTPLCWLQFSLLLRYSLITVCFIECRIAFYTNRVERSSLLVQQPDVVTTSIDEVSSNAKPLLQKIRKVPKRIKKLLDMLPKQEACTLK